jgi:hypothetical protein
MIKGKLFIAVILIECFVLLALYLHSSVAQESSRMDELQAKKVLVTRLGLTDFAIWTEARYTRHPSQTDFFSAFQDFPGSPDHFPAGSIIAPSHVSPGDLQ